MPRAASTTGSLVLEVETAPKQTSKWQHVAKCSWHALSHSGPLTHAHQSHEHSFLSQSNQLSELESHAQSPCDLAQSSIALPPVFVMWMNLSSSESHWASPRCKGSKWFKATGYLRSLRLASQGHSAGLDIFGFHACGVSHMMDSRAGN